MKNGLNRFEFYLVKLEDLLLQASKEKNAALFLYSNDARTPLFMLEGLAKLHAGMHNKKRFSKIKEDCKLLEDALGAIDYYDAYAKEFAGNPHIDPEITNYLQGQAREKIQHLQDILTGRGWIGEQAKRIRKIRKKLTDADWMKDDKEVDAIEIFYKESTRKIKKEFEQHSTLTDIENQVHELRRKLRWLSIYPRALQGLVQLQQSNNADAAVQKYLTPETINSPFNKMPEPGHNRYILLLEKNYFLALSWMIATLGKLKDYGLRVVVITEALQQIKGLDHNTALASTYEILGPQHPGISTILADASAICRTYFGEDHLNKLIAGTRKIS